MKNVLVLITDQQRKDSLGCYGNSVCQTPNLDKLAAEGIRFDCNYVANPICMPSRLSLFTGKNIRNHGLWTNGLNIPECETLPGHFQKNGYQTACIGKIHFTPYGGDAGNMESMHLWKKREEASKWTGPYWGFEHVELTLGHTAPLAHYGEWFYRNGGTNEMLKLNNISGPMQSGTRELPEELHDSAFVSDRVNDYIKHGRNPGKPFFLVASFPDPHYPFNPPVAAAKKYDKSDVIMPVREDGDRENRPKHYCQHFRGEWNRKGSCPARHPDGISESYTRELISHTYGMVDLIDRNIGKILAALEKEGIRDDTVIVFTSDHGELLGDHGLWFKGPFFYEGLINTPLIINCPSMIKNKVSNTLFSDIDLAPTLCDLARIPLMPYMNGVSQVTHLMNKDISVRNKCLVEYRNGYGTNDCSSKVLVTGKYKYVRYQTGEEELTDLSEDPDELRNVADLAGYQQIKNRLKSELLDEILSTEPKGPKQVALA